MFLWRTVVGKLWLTIMVLVAVVISTLGLFLIHYIDIEFAEKPDQIKRLFALTSLIGFLLTTFFAFFLMFKITQPLRQLKRATHYITMGDYRSRVHIRSYDEIGELAEAFNTMADKLLATIGDLEYEKERVESILRSMSDAVITFDSKGKIVACNPHGQSLFHHWGADRTQPVIGKPVLQPWMPEALSGLFTAVRTQNKELTTKIEIASQTWSVVMNPLYTVEHPQGVVAVLRDVSEETRLDKLRNDFVANVSHELRTPLSLVQGYSEALLDQIETSAEQRQDLVHVIHDESLRMGRLVHDLLDLAQLQAGHVQLHPMEVHVVPLLQRVVRKFTAVAKEDHIGLHLAQTPTEVRLAQADEQRIEQIFTNLVDNAIRHSRAGQHVTIRLFDEGERIRIDVCDEGEGIATHDLPYVFERFYKADRARKRQPHAIETGGTGLGLSIVKQLVEAHGGTITVHSTIGQGATFVVVFPLHPVKSV